MIADLTIQEANLLALVRLRVEVLREARDLRPHAVLNAQTSCANTVVEEPLKYREVQVVLFRELVHAITRAQLQVVT